MGRLLLVPCRRAGCTIMPETAVTPDAPVPPISSLTFRAILSQSSHYTQRAIHAHHRRWLGIFCLRYSLAGTSGSRELADSVRGSRAAEDALQVPPRRDAKALRRPQEARRIARHAGEDLQAPGGAEGKVHRLDRRFSRKDAA